MAKVHGDTATPEAAASSVQKLLSWEKESFGVDAVRRNRLSASHTVLWLNRGLCFLQTIMELFAADAAAPLTPRQCASTAYTMTLRPYHSILISGLFRAGISFAPADRATMIANFGWEGEEDAKSDVARCAAAMRPVTHRVGTFLKAEGLDFPDKVGSPMQAK